jgi:hypothetical protein
MSGGPNQVAFDDRKNWPDQVAFDGNAEDFPTAENQSNNTSFKVFKIGAKQPLPTSKQELYFKKLRAVDATLKELETKQTALSSRPYASLNPDELLFLSEYPSQKALLETERGRWECLVNGVDDYIDNHDQSSGANGDPTTIIETTYAKKGVSLSGFEKDILEMEYQPRHDSAVPSKLPSGDSRPNTLYDKDIENLTPDSVKSSTKFQSCSSMTKKKKLMIGLGLLFLILVAVGVSLWLIFQRVPPPVPPPPRSTPPTPTPARAGPPTSYSMSLFAGTGIQELRDGNVNDAQFYNPSAIAVDPRNDDLIVTDRSSIRRISNGEVSTIAGDGTSGFSDGMGRSARVGVLPGVTVAPDGIIYFADSNNYRIRSISTEGRVQTVSGNGTRGSLNRIASESLWADPYGIAINQAGEIFVTDQDSRSIRRISSDSIVSTFVTLDFVPRSLVFDKDGNLIVTGRGTNNIRRVTPSGDVTILSINFSNPWGLVIDEFDIIYVTEIDTGVVSAILPNRTKITVASGFNQPLGMAIDSKGIIYVANALNHTISTISPRWD